MADDGWAWLSYLLMCGSTKISKGRVCAMNNDEAEHNNEAFFMGRLGIRHWGHSTTARYFDGEQWLGMAQLPSNGEHKGMLSMA